MIELVKEKVVCAAGGDVWRVSKPESEVGKGVFERCEDGEEVTCCSERTDVEGQMGERGAGGDEVGEKSKGNGGIEMGVAEFPAVGIVVCRLVVRVAFFLFVRIFGVVLIVKFETDRLYVRIEEWGESEKSWEEG
jgi:hypothetical protein